MKSFVVAILVLMLAHIQATIAQQSTTHDLPVGPALQNQGHWISTPTAPFTSIVFRTPAGITATLHVTGYDIDAPEEVEVRLNGRSLGFLSRGENNGVNTGDSFELLEDNLNHGEQNLLEFHQVIAGGSWGIHRLQLTTKGTDSASADHMPSQCQGSIANRNHPTLIQSQQLLAKKTDSALGAESDSVEKNLIISELLASNDTGITDRHGDNEDWIEIFNAGSTPIRMTNWCLTDDVDSPTKWCFPDEADTILPAGDYLVVFASNKNEWKSGEYHTNFKLSKSGEYVALSNPAGQIVDEYSPFPALKKDQSFGKLADLSSITYSTPTPGKKNSDTAAVSATTIAFDRKDIISFLPSHRLTLSGPSSSSEIDIEWSVGSADWLSIDNFSTQHHNGCVTVEATLNIDRESLDTGSHSATITVRSLGRPDAMLSVNVIVPTERIAVSEWDAANVTFDGYSLAVDDADQRLFHSLGDQHQQPTQYTPTVTYNTQPGYQLRFNNVIVQSGQTLALGLVDYSTKNHQLQLYKQDKLVHEYTLVYSNLPIVYMKALHVASGAKLPGLVQVISREHQLSTPFFNMGIEFRGNTARTYPKKPFNVELRADMKLKNSQTINASFFGMRNDDDWILDAAYRDTSFVRNIVSHGLWNDLQEYAYLDDERNPGGQSAPRGDLVEVILDNQYQGVHVMHERTDRKLLKLAKGPDSVLYKAIGSIREPITVSDIESQFSQKYPDADQAMYWKPLQEHLDFIRNSSDEDFINEIDNRINIDNFVDFFLLTLLSSSTDTLRKNYFLYRNNTDKFHITTWDFDATFGMDWNGALKQNSTTYWPETKHPLFQRLLEQPETGFNKKLITRWTHLRQHWLSEENIVARFQAYADQLQPISDDKNNAFYRNLKRWPDSGGSGKDQPELGTTDWIGSWLAERLPWLDSKISELKVD